MKLALPLYVRVLGLFLLNVLVIGVAFWVVFRMQFHFGLDSFLAGQANRRVRALSDVIIRELQETPRDQMDMVLQRFSESFHLDLYVFRANGDQLAGTNVVLPSEVSQLIRRHGFGRGAGLAGNRPGAGPQRGPPWREPLDAEPSPSPDGIDPVGPEVAPPVPFETPVRRGLGPPWLEGDARAALPTPFFVKSDNPTRYWAGQFFILREPRAGSLQVLLFASNSLTGGGLFFDSSPWLAAGCAGLILSALIWLPFVRNITRSLSQMARATDDMSVGRFETRVPARRSDELGQLAQAINTMAVRLEGFVHGQRRFLGDIAHELCSPLARIQTALGILEHRGATQDQAYIKDLQEEAEHMSQLVAELLSFSKASMNQSKVPLGPVVLAEVVATAVRREQIEGASIRLEIPDGLVVHANPELVQRALANLLRNAARYAGPAGPTTVAAWEEEGKMVVEVADQGPGVPEESLPRLFDPFYRVDESRARDTGGVGLGLTIVKTCIESCGGTVSAHNGAHGGLQVRLCLEPVRNPAPETLASPQRLPRA